MTTPIDVLMFKCRKMCPSGNG